MNLVVEEFELAICRLAADFLLPTWLPATGLRTVTWTRDETSTVCVQAVVPVDVITEGDWRALRVAGPLEFNLTGVLASIARTLADAQVPIFAVSTYDTDYVLVKRGTLHHAIDTLHSVGHEIVEWV